MLGTLDDEDVSIEVLKHRLRDAPDLIDGGFDKLNAAFQREVVKLAAIFYFEDPPRFLANASFVVVDGIARRKRFGNFQNDANVPSSPRGNDFTRTPYG